MIFRDEHARTFAAVSHDRNPLHLDADYSRRTVFGQPVVYGVASVLAALGAWANGRPFAMRSLRIRFKQPIFFEQGYEITQATECETVKRAVVRNGVVRTEISFEPVNGFTAETHVVSSSFNPAPQSLDLANDVLIERYASAKLEYGIGTAALAELR